METLPTTHEAENSREHIDEASLRAIGDKTVRAAWLDRSERARSLTGSEVNPISGKGNIATHGYQGGYQVTEIPIALPIASRDSLDQNDSDRLRKWSDMDESERELYGYDTRAETSIAFDNLKPEVKQTLLANRSFEIQAKSNDAAEIAKASERNLTRVKTGTILRPTDVTHATRPENLLKILENGVLAGELLGEDAALDKFPYNLDVSSIPSNVDQYQVSYADVMSQANFHAGGNIMLVLDRSETSTDFNNEVIGTVGDRHENHRLIFGGVPSTEIAAICISPVDEHSINPAKALHDAHQTALQVIDQVLHRGQYIPVLDHKGNLVLTAEEFTQRRESGDYGNFTKEVFIDRAEQEIEIPAAPAGMF